MQVDCGKSEFVESSGKRTASISLSFTINSTLKIHNFAEILFHLINIERFSRQN